MNHRFHGRRRQKIFKLKKYKIKFNKKYQSVSWGVCKEVTDSYILYILRQLQGKYKFTVIKTKLKRCFYESYIIIRCTKDEKFDIFNEFCFRLNGKIENVII